MSNVDKILAEMQEQEKRRQQFVAEGIANGCEACSQWDGYWGCNKCQLVLDGYKKGEQR